jgi:hypothetical protein
MRWIGAVGLGLLILGCGGVGDLVEDVGDGVEKVVAQELEKGVAKGLGVPAEEVDIRKEGDRWQAKIPQGQGDCALGAHSNGAGLPVAMDDVFARCDVTIDLEDLAGKEAAKTVGNRFDVAVRRSAGGVAGQVAARRKELKAAGMQVVDLEHEGFTVLVGMTDNTPTVVAAVGDAGAGPIEFVAVPKNARKGDGGKRGGGKAGKGKSGKKR